MHSSSLVAVLETRLGGAAPARALVLRAVVVAWACAALASGCRCGSAATSCDAGFVAMGKSCVPQVDDCALDAGVGSVTVGFQCAEQHRACEASGGAHCTSCLDGYEDFDGGLGCEVPVRCEELHCEDQNRACVASPNGHCGECLGGYLRDAGVEACRKPLTCAGLTCADGLNCLEPADGGDAVCSSSCGPNAIPSGKGVCVECPACDRTSLGEDGPWLGALTLENRCICRTWPGFFWEEGQFPGVKPCDEDGDGFVRESAKLALASASAAVSENARCLLRTVTSVTLENEQGQQWAVPVNPGLALYETDRNDDPDALSLAMVRGQLPLAYGANGRAVSAKEINSFTKFCVSTQADFNENGLADVAEWQANPTLTSVGATFKPFVPFSYFAELNRGWFEPDTAAGTTGRWHVEERSRLSNALAGDGIGFADIPDAGTHCRSCERFRDSAYDTLVTVGGPQQNFDFARLARPTPGGRA